MDTGDALSGAGFGLVALLLAASGVRILTRGTAPEPLLQAFSRFGMAVGCAALAAGLLLSASRMTSGVLLAVAIVALLVAVAFETKRNRRLRQD
ncbi:hypothetical protein [Paractinoplanes atraurantiacus]|uniref:Uncharacterized protein n=1 Tax=Paractinoplanes atraurantiacus TaxID=1036182 RepID=A0A285JJT7_9ACTN|nr:hypothetical protein [Actinoplanes atraurantiacus]SNY59626.1 hypothetical protein SAMN05421748_120178 [Actinoplanes atraurantiacus]